MSIYELQTGLQELPGIVFLGVIQYLDRDWQLEIGYTSWEVGGELLNHDPLYLSIVCPALVPKRQFKTTDLDLIYQCRQRYRRRKKETSQYRRYQKNKSRHDWEVNDYFQKRGQTEGFGILPAGRQKHLDLLSPRERKEKKRMLLPISTRKPMTQAEIWNLINQQLNETSNILEEAKHISKYNWSFQSYWDETWVTVDNFRQPRKNIMKLTGHLYPELLQPISNDELTNFIQQKSYQDWCADLEQNGQSDVKFNQQIFEQTSILQ